MTVAFYDARAEQAVNETASVALDYINRLYRENSRPSFHLAEVCFRAARHVAPDAELRLHLEMARLAQSQVRQVVSDLRECVAA
jgi:hypothetical protein